MQKSQNDLLEKEVYINCCPTESIFSQIVLLISYQCNYGHCCIRIICTLLKLYKSYTDLEKEDTQVNQALLST